MKKEPVRLQRSLETNQNSEAKLLLTERIWSRKAEIFYNKVETHLGVSEIFSLKEILGSLAKKSIKIYKDG